MPNPGTSPAATPRPRALLNRALPVMAAAAILTAMVMPLPVASGGRLFTAAETSAHFVLFLMLGWCAVRIGSWWGCVWGRPLAALAVLAVLVELAQFLTGRDPDVLDACVSLAGAVAGVALTASWGAGSSWRSAMASVLAAVLGALSFAPVAMVMADRVQAHLTFPLLASFEGRSEVGRWWEHDCRLSRVKTQATQGEYALRVVLFKARGVYPGLFMTDSRRDWGDYSRLCFDVYLAGNAERGLWIRADDRSDYPPYDDRAQTLINLAPGANSICLDLNTFLRTPVGREVDRHHIYRWGMFFDDAKGGETFYLDNVRLGR